MADSSDDDGYLADMAFMLEGSKPSTWKCFEWTKKVAPSDAPSNIHVALSVVDDEPGALQSGHYLWPAASALVQHLLNETSNKPTTIVELGAGCALPSIAALQLFSDSLKCVVVTDHDPGTLKRARNNHDRTLESLQERHGVRYAQQLSSVPVSFEPLTWGDEKGANALLEALRSTTHATKAFDWVLGSDIIYCVDVVEPLLLTASLLLEKDELSQIVLAQSFPYDDETEKAIDTASVKLGLQRTIATNTFGQNGGICIQKFQWRSEKLS